MRPIEETFRPWKWIERNARQTRAPRFYTYIYTRIMDNYKSMNVPVHGFCNDDSITGLRLNPSKARTRRKIQLRSLCASQIARAIELALFAKKRCLRFDSTRCSRARRSKNRPWKGGEFFPAPFFFSSLSFSLFFPAYTSDEFFDIARDRKHIFFFFVCLRKLVERARFHVDSPGGMFKKEEEEKNERRGEFV